MMKRVKFFIAFFFFTLIFFPEISAASQCRAPKPLLQYKPLISKTKFNISESAFELHAAQGGRAGGLVTGVTFSPLDYRYEALFKITRTDKGVCVAIDKIKVAFRAQPIVFISNEFPRGSCEFKAVLVHENKHVAALKRVHAKYAKPFRVEVENALERSHLIGPINENQIEAAKNKIQESFKFYLDTYMQGLNGKLAYQQNLIDNPAEYERVFRQCDGWAGRLRLE